MRRCLVSAAVAGLVAFLTVALPTPCTAGAWGLEKNEILIELYNKCYFADADFDEDGNRIDKPNGGEYREFSPEIKIDYGFSNKLDLLAYLQFKRARYDDNNVDLVTSGISDARLGFRYVLRENERKLLVASIQALVKIPTGYDEDESPPLGQGQVDIEVRGLFGRSFLRVREESRGHEITRDRAFVGAELGFRWRAEFPAHQIVYFVQGGIYIGAGITIQAEIDGVEGLAGLGGMDEDYTIFRVGPVYSSMGTASPVAPGRNLRIGIFFGRTIMGESTAIGEEITLTVSYQYAF